MKNCSTKFIKLFVFLLMASVTVFGQDKADAAKTEVSSTNQLAILMIVVAIVLAFVIWGMGRVLTELGRQLLQKSKSNKTVPVILLAVFSLLSLQGHAQETDVIQTVPNYGGLSSTAFWAFTAVIFTEVVIIVFLLFFIRRLQSELLPETAKVKKSGIKLAWAKLDKKIFTKAVAIEKEADVMLDHDYDGIRELDNALPPWWKYGFGVTVVIGVIYLLNFHVFGYGKNPTQEYEEELAKAAIAKEAYEAKNKDRVDENHLQTPDATGIAAGKEIFTTTCWPCHGKLGEGGAGPNLTDNYWLHKGGLSDVYQSIKHGYPEKGMQAWEKNFTPKDILNLAAYIKTLKGTNPPNGKAQQGDLFDETAGSDSTKATIAKDSTKKIIPADSNKVTKQ